MRDLEGLTFVKRSACLHTEARLQPPLPQNVIRAHDRLLPPKANDAVRAANVARQATTACSERLERLYAARGA